MTSDDIINAAAAQIGTPFRHQGRLSGKCLDCAGLIVIIAHQLGFEYNELPGYGRIPYQGLLEAVLDSQPCLERVFEKQPGDILLIKFRTDPQHLAIFTGDTIIHSFSVVKKVCEHRFDRDWENRICRIYRFKGLNQ